MPHSKKNKKNGVLSVYRPKSKPSEKSKKPHRFHPGTVALREIAYYQKYEGWLIPKACFELLVREIAQGFKVYDEKSGKEISVWFEGKALDALQEGAESYLAEMFERANTHAMDGGRKTIRDREAAEAVAKKRAEKMGTELDYEKHPYDRGDVQYAADIMRQIAAAAASNT